MAISLPLQVPLYSGNRPELDVTRLLDDTLTNYYQNFIAILRWIVELGRVKNLVDVALLAHFLLQPWEGNLEQALHISAYLKKHKKPTMVFDDTLPNIDESAFTPCNWGEFYHDAKEAIPINASEP
jgi:hypothetical protein